MATLAPRHGSSDDTVAGPVLDSAVTVPVGMDLFDLGTPNLIRSLDTPPEEERARQNLPHILPRTWCEISFASRGRDACHRNTCDKRDALIPIIELGNGESGRDGDANNNLMSRCVLFVKVAQGW